MELLLILLCFAFLPSLATYSSNECITKEEFDTLQNTVQLLVSEIGKLKDSNVQDSGITNTEENPAVKRTNNYTVEERVTILEFQVKGLTDDVALLDADVTSLDANVASLDADVTDVLDDIDVVEEEVAAILTGQTIQDTRILQLEESNDGVVDSITALEAADDELSSALGVLENQVTAVNTTLSGTIQDVVELQNTAQELDGRVSELEVDGTVAFQSVLYSYTTLPVGSTIVFENVDLNIGNGYDNTTGLFTVPPGGSGLYYVFVEGLTAVTEFAGVGIRLNGVRLCYTFGDGRTEHYGTFTCGAVAQLSEGDVVYADVSEEIDDTPIYMSNVPYNRFMGFRIAPQ